MRTLLKFAVVILACNFFVACTSKNKNENEPNAQKSFKAVDVSGDQADLFAIPFDTNELEDQQESDQLQSPEGEAEKKPTKATSEQE